MKKKMIKTKKSKMLPRVLPKKEKVGIDKYGNKISTIDYKGKKFNLM